MQAEVGNFALFFALLFGFVLLGLLLVSELIQPLLVNSCLRNLLIKFEHLLELDMPLLHFKYDPAPLDAFEAISAANEQFHCRFAQVLLMDVLPVDIHDMIICLHLAKLAHKNMESMFCIDVELR